MPTTHAYHPLPLSSDPLCALSHQEVRQILDRNGFASIPDPIIELAQGSPQTAITAWETLQNISPDLLAALQNLPLPLVEALTIGKRISQELDLNTQLWLIDYLQTQQWQTQKEIRMLQDLEQAKQWLQGFVSPRLVWEVILAQRSGSLG